MIQPDFNVVDKMSAEVIDAINDPDAEKNAGTAVGVLRVALRTLVHFVGRDAAGDVLRKEALDVGVLMRSLDSIAEPPRNQRDEDFAEELIATGFWAVCVGAGAVIGFVLSRALP